MCVWLSFQTKEALFAALRLTFYVNYKRLLHLMADISHCFGFNGGNRALLGLLIEAVVLYETVAKNLMLSDVERGSNLMLTRLTPVAILTDTKQQSATISFSTQIVTFS